MLRSVLAVPTSIPAELTASEREALVAAASWYASYHAHAIAADADDPSLAAITDRERYVSLVAALRKLGVRIALPDELTGWGSGLAA